MRARHTGVAIVLALAIAGALAACGGGGSAGSNDELFTSDGFGRALDSVGGEVGDDARVLQVQITHGGAQFQVSEPAGVRGFIYTDGELRDVEIEGSSLGEGFPLSEIHPGAVDEIKDGVESASGSDDVELTALALEESSLGGSLSWMITAQAGGRTQLFSASADGSGVAPL